MKIDVIKEDSFKALELDAGVLLTDFNESFRENPSDRKYELSESNLENTQIEIPRLNENKKIALQRNLMLRHLDKDGRVKLSCVCDSTMLFLVELVWTLEAAGCTDIETKSRAAKQEEIPLGKPWCSWYYEASGLLTGQE